MLRKITFPLAASAAALALILVSVPLKGQKAGDYLANAGPALLVQAGTGSWKRAPVPQDAPERSAWHVPFSAVDGAYVLGPSPSAVSSVSGSGGDSVSVTLDSASGSAFVISAQDPFVRYSVSDAAGTFSLKFLRGGAVSVSFLKSAAGRPEVRIYPYNAVVSLEVMENGRKFASADVYPGTLVRYDPATARELAGADALRVSQVAQFSSLDFRADAFPATAFGSGSALLAEAFRSDLGGQVSVLMDTFRRRSLLRFEAASVDSPALLNPSKKAIALQNDLLDGLNAAVASRDGSLRGKVRVTLQNLGALGPEFEAAGMRLVREFYLPYWFSRVQDADPDVMLGTDPFTVSMRELYGCHMASKQFAGVSNLFGALLFHDAVPSGAARRMDRSEFERYLYSYSLSREAPSAAVAATGAALPEASRRAACSDEERPTAAGYRSFWAFLLQYLDRPEVSGKPLPSTLKLADVALRIGKVRFSLMSPGPFEARKTEAQFAVLAYQKIFRSVLSGLEAALFSSRSPYVFDERVIRGDDLQVDRDLVLALSSMSLSLASAADSFFPSTETLDAPQDAVRVLRSTVESKFRPETVAPIRYLECVVSNDRAYRFPAPGEPAACSDLLPPGFSGPKASAAIPSWTGSAVPPSGTGQVSPLLPAQPRPAIPQPR